MKGCIFTKTKTNDIMILQVLNTSTNNLVNLKFDNGLIMMRHIQAFCDDRHQLSVVENGKTVFKGRDEIMHAENFF